MAKSASASAWAIRRTRRQISHTTLAAGKGQRNQHRKKKQGGTVWSFLSKCNYLQVSRCLPYQMEESDVQRVRLIPSDS